MSVVTTTAPESLRMYATSALWSFGSIGTTPSPAPLNARYASIQSGPFGSMSATFSSRGRSANAVPYASATA